MSLLQKESAISQRHALPIAVIIDGKHIQIVRREVSPGIWVGRNVYDGVLGIGYTDFTEVIEGDITHRNAVHTGPEAHRDKHNDVWVEIIQEVL